MTEWRCWSWCLVFFVTYQQQYVPVISARTGTRVPGRYCQHMCTLDPGSLAEPFSSIPLHFLWSVQLSCLWICFHVYTIRIIIYRDTLLATSVGYFLQWKKGYLYVTMGGAPCALHFCRAAWPTPHTTGKKTRSCCFQVKSNRDVAPI